MRIHLSILIGFVISLIVAILFPRYVLVTTPLVLAVTILYQKIRSCTCFSRNKEEPCPYHSRLYAEEEVRCAMKLGRKNAVISLLTSNDRYIRTAAKKFLKKHPKQRKRK